MIGSFQIRTDLALEAREGYDGDESRIRGVTVQEESDPEMRQMRRICRRRMKGITGKFPGNFPGTCGSLWEREDGRFLWWDWETGK